MTETEYSFLQTSSRDPLGLTSRRLKDSKVKPIKSIDSIVGKSTVHKVSNQFDQFDPLRDTAPTIRIHGRITARMELYLPRNCREASDNRLELRLRRKRGMRAASRAAGVRCVPPETGYLHGVPWSLVDLQIQLRAN